MGFLYLKKKGLLVYIGGMLLLLGAQGCVATRNWVTEQMAPLTGRVTEVEGRVSTVEGRVNEMGGKLSSVESRLGQADAKADQALAGLANLRLERKLVLDLKEGANFGFDSAALSESTKREIDGFLSDIKKDLKETDKTIFLIAGHTDNTGSQEYNRELGRKRAERVAEYLIVNKGIDPTKVRTVSYGESAPIAENTRKAGRSKNRRVEIMIYKETITSASQLTAAR